MLPRVRQSVPATLDGPSMDHMSVKFNNGHSSVLVRIQLHECETAISMHAYLRKVSNGLEERYQVRLSAIRAEIANVDGSVVLVRLPHDCLVNEGTTQEVHTGRSSSATTHWRTTRAGLGTSLGLLIGPGDTNNTRTKPLAVHQGDGLLRVGLVTEGHETIAKRLARVHVPHDTSIGQRAKSGEDLGKDSIVDLGREVTNEDIEMIRRVLLVLLASICPVYSNFGVEDLTAVEDLKSGFCGTHVHVLDEAMIKATGVLVDAAVRDDDLDVLNWTSDGKHLREHVLGHPWAQIFHVEVGTLLAGDTRIR